MEIKITSLEPLAEAAKDFIQKVITPPAEEIGGLLADKFRLFRFKNQVEIVSKAEEYLKQKNIKTKKVSLKILAPLLEDCSLEEDENLKNRWASLLAHTVKEGSTIDNNLYSEILRQLSSNDAKVFDLIFQHSTTSNQSESAKIWVKNNNPVRVVDPSRNFPNLHLNLDNLVRLRLIRDTQLEDHFVLTNLGFNFKLVCEFL